MAEQQPQAKFVLKRIYLKDASFESPSSPAIFSKPWQPKMSVDLNTRSEKVGDTDYEVVLDVTITAKVGEETAFLVEIQQAGLFLIDGVQGEQARQLLGIACPNMLFPYVRETVDATVVRGGFPALAMQPVNFETLYRQASEQQAAAQSGGNSTH